MPDSLLPAQALRPEHLGLVALPAPAPFAVWLADLRVPVPVEQLAWLSSAEQAQAARFHFDHLQQRYRAAHTLLRGALGSRLGRAPQALDFVASPHGKPALAGEPAAEFNLSHSEDVALIAWGGQEVVGVDVEVERHIGDLDNLAAHSMAAEEVAELRALPEARRQRAFLELWTAKEACLKAVGSGLSVSSGSFVLRLGGGVQLTTLRFEGRGYRVEVQELAAGPGRVAALARVLR